MNTQNWLKLTIVQGLFCAALPAQTLVNEQFADDNRTGQNPPASLAWYSSDGSGLTVADGAMTLVTAGASGAVRHAVAHFDSTSLATGDSLAFSFDFEVTGLSVGTNINGLRFGLFDSGGVLFSADGQNPSDNVYKGYIGSLNPQHSTSGTASLRISERTGSAVLLTAATAYEVLRNNAGLPAATTGAVYHVQMGVERTDDLTLAIAMTISGGSLANPFVLTTTDTASLATTFDTLGFSIQNSSSSGGVSEVVLSNIQLVYSPIPEPSTYALLLGLGVLPLAAYRLRRNRSGARG